MHPAIMATISAIEIIIILSLLFRFSAGASSVIHAGGGATNTIIRSLAAE